MLAGAEIALASDTGSRSTCRKVPQPADRRLLPRLPLQLCRCIPQALVSYHAVAGLALRVTIHIKLSAIFPLPGRIGNSPRARDFVS